MKSTSDWCNVTISEILGWLSVQLFAVNCFYLSSIELDEQRTQLLNALLTFTVAFWGGNDHFNVLEKFNDHGIVMKSIQSF